jgi:hypothetical protein
MARFNEILVGRYNRGLQKHFGLKGGPPAPQLASEISVSFPLLVGKEHRWVDAWNLWGVGLAAGPFAAQISDFRLRNPAGSNIAAVIEKLLVSTALANIITMSNRLALADADLASVAATVPMDRRLGISAQSIVKASFQTGAAPGVAFGLFQTLAGAPFDVLADTQHEIVLMPGDFIQLDTGVANDTMRVTAWWRERFLEEGERQ